MFWRLLFKSNWYFWLISLGLVSCNNAKYTQCQQIIEIANQVNRQTQEIINDSSDLREAQSDRRIEPDIWSQAATIMTQAAAQIDTLSLKDSQLVDYQNSLVEMFRLYSQATYDAIEARENKNLQALKSASESAKKAGLLKDKLEMEINSYCLGKAIIK